MTSTVLALAALCAVAAAIRSTWSPCGLSMLSTITPMAERTRGRHWWVTVGWFVAGATIGGIGLGVVGAVGALGVSAIGTTATTALAIAVAAALSAAAMDLGVAGPELPHHRRQVDEQWLDQYRGWVYGFAFGAQIGSGLATYIMTAGVYLTVVLTALTGEPVAALAIGALFGFARGLAILLGLRLTTPDRLRRFHRRFESLRAPVRTAMVAFELLAAAAGATVLAASGAPVALVAVVVTVTALVATGLTTTIRRRSRTHPFCDAERAYTDALGITEPELRPVGPRT